MSQSKILRNSEKFEEVEAEMLRKTEYYQFLREKSYEQPNVLLLQEIW